MATKTRSGLSMTDAQRTLLANLQAKVLQSDDDGYEYREGLIDALGEPFIVSDGMEAWRPKFLASNGDEINRDTASACIGVLRSMDVPRCPGYCRQRGVSHSLVRYYDDHYDYECGLS